MAVTDAAGDTLVQDADSRRRALELSSDEETPPSCVPGYQIVRRIGSGQYGSVWLAREQNTGKFVAAKFYRQRRGVDSALLSREVEKLAVLYTSRLIVRLVAVGWDHEPPYYVMEYLENGSLAHRLAQGPLPVSEAVRIATRVAQALVHAHGSGILHCDLKPANVLLDADWEPRLCDFGQSRLVDEQSPALGTLFYMAPEQADLKAVPDARWDVYALGALLYQMVTGQPPHRTDETERQLRDASDLASRLDLYRRIVTTGPRPTGHRRMWGVDPLLAEIIDRCLAVDRQRRYPNAQAVLDRLVSRERHRARRPLVLMGLVLPLLLMIGLLPFAVDALRDAVTTSRSNIVRRALESDALSVNLLAHALQRELQSRQDELVTLTDDEEVRAAIEEHIGKERSQRKPLVELLDERIAAIQQRRASAGREPDASWFLQDVLGVQRWRFPESGTLDRSYACRDYFHGRGVDFFDKDCPGGLTPIRGPHISVPYLSTSSGRYVVALSAPVWSLSPEKGGEPVILGVLARTFYLSELLKDYEAALRAQGASAGRTLTLVDARTWSLLAHDWLTDQRLRKLNDATQTLRLEDRIIEVLRPLTIEAVDALGEPPDRLSDYRDPVGALAPEHYGGEWLAAFSRVGDTGWIAVVQEPREPVMKPVDDLRGRLVGSVMGGMVLAGVVVAGCWWLLIVLMGERAGRWLMRWRRGTVSASLTGKASEQR